MSKQYVNLKLGDVVHHRNFGEGVIISLSGSGKSAQVRIKFKKTHTRNFALGWAPLSKVEVKQTALREVKDAEQTSKTEPNFKEILDSIQKKYCLKDSNFGGFNLSENISRSDVIAYTRKFGLRHLQELRHAFRELFVSSTQTSPPLSPVDVLDIGCGPGLSQFILPEFGITKRTYSGFDYAVNCLWLAKELTNHFESINMPRAACQFVRSIHEIKTSEIHGFVIMNHVQNQPSVNEVILKMWAAQLKRIYPHGFYLLSIEPRKPEFREKATLFLEKLREEGITIQNLVLVDGRGEFGAKSKAVNWLVCGK
jgi:hypothetical protein